MGGIGRQWNALSGIRMKRDASGTDLCDDDVMCAFHNRKWDGRNTDRLDHPSAVEDEG